MIMSTNNGIKQGGEKALWKSIHMHVHSPPAITLAIKIAVPSQGQKQLPGAWNILLGFQKSLKSSKHD